MIISPFDIRIRNKRYDFLDRISIDSASEEAEVNTAIIQQLQDSQQDAMCLALNIAEVEVPIPNFGFGVYDDGVRIGVYLMASCKQITTSPLVVEARHMPGFSVLSQADEEELAAETTFHFLEKPLPTVAGGQITFQKISWAIFEDRTDAKSLRDIGIHNKIINDPRIKATLVPDDTDANLTRVDVELM